MLKESELTRNFCFQQRITQITQIFHGLFLSRQAPKIFKKDFQRISARKGTKKNKVLSVLPVLFIKQEIGHFCHCLIKIMSTKKLNLEEKEG